METRFELEVQEKIGEDIQIASMPTETLQSSLSELSGLLKAWEEYWDESIRKARDAWKNLVRKRDTVADKMREKIKSIKVELLCRQAEQMKEKEALLKESQACAEAGLDAVADELALQASIKGSQPIIKTRTQWRWEVEDVDKIPKQWFTLDVKAINEHVRKNKDAQPIPGIRIFAEKIAVGG